MVKEFFITQCKMAQTDLDEIFRRVNDGRISLWDWHHCFTDDGIIPKGTYMIDAETCREFGLDYNEIEGVLIVGLGYLFDELVNDRRVDIIDAIVDRSEVKDWCYAPMADELFIIL